MTDDDHSLDLHWYALAYQSAGVPRIAEAYRELEACVERIKAAERERCAKACAEIAARAAQKAVDGYEGQAAAEACEEAIRALK